MDTELLHSLSREDGEPIGSFTARARSWLPAHVREAGAVLIRGSASSVEEFTELAGSLTTELMPEREGFASRTSHGAGICSASRWPADQPMCMHHERSYGRTTPGLVLIGCLTAPERGGETGLAHAGRVARALPPDLVDRFGREGWILERNYGDLVGVTLAEAFGTEDRARIERYCADNDIEYTWKDGETLHTRQHRPALVRHPDTGQRHWFNQIAFFNEWTMEPDVRDYLVGTFGPDALPFNTRYGDGSPIGPETIAGINEVYQAHTIRHTWSSGEVLCVDNLAMATSREPYSGARELLLALGDPVRTENLAPATAS
ncbi:TauD/TfdA family dioxygenase [Sciscionella sediminilitoris]|uniref:TauD/TfdA family dioxygenase n=1 Tax=Sciscionella sediminilitoris TaxID=1445613 RepID=UPI00068BD8A4|nr:TauD/TfdA family dioxygenase [Sciscionella sp. SE31]